jgi:hypothetical protein
VFSVLMLGCFGSMARDNVLVPAMALAFDGVEKSVHAGIADAVATNDIHPETAAILLSEMDRLHGAIAAGNREALRGIDWPSLNAYATRGVAARVTKGELGVNGAKLHLRRVAKFNEAYFKALQR